MRGLLDAAGRTLSKTESFRQKTIKIMNLPNQLTVLRLFLTAGFVVCMESTFPWHFTAALVLLTAAALTDYFDGAIARSRNLITDFGKLMDPLADKVLTASAFICLSSLGVIPAWAVIVVIAREFLITGLRLLAASKNIVLPAERLGKHKTAWQIITMFYFTGQLGADEFLSRPLRSSSPNLPAILDTVGWIILIVMLVLTVYSGVAYAWKNRHLISVQ